MLTKLILKTLDPELTVFVAAAEGRLSQAFKSICGRFSFNSNFHEDTAKLYQPCCIKEIWKTVAAKQHANNKLSKQIQN